MALENLTGTDKFIDDLTATNPVIADDVSEGDDHIRGIKNVLKNTFPNVTGAVSATQTELNNAQQNVQSDWDATSGDAFIDNQPTLGTSSSLDVAEANYDAADAEVVRGDDTRLTDSRTPEAHSHDVEGTALKSTNETGGTKFLREDGDGTSSWQTTPDTDTVYTHPNHSGEVTSTSDGATVIVDDIVDEANLKVSNAPTNGYVLTAQSGVAGGLTWAADSTTDSTKLPLTGGTMTGTTTLKGITETEPAHKTASFTVDLSEGTIFELTGSGNITVTMPAVASGKSFTVINSSTGTLGWGTSPVIKWASDTVPTDSGISIYSFISNGTFWYGMQAGSAFTA
ncbi:MAG: hypothetical protein NZ811_03675 [Gammaproteobacteria bacterium]|nr:hypothetical protein [Gammaproteobacteria bacterium]